MWAHAKEEGYTLMTSVSIVSRSLSAAWGLMTEGGYNSG